MRNKTLKDRAHRAEQFLRQLSIEASSPSPRDPILLGRNEAQSDAQVVVRSPQMSVFVDERSHGESSRLLLHKCMWKPAPHSVRRFQREGGRAIGHGTMLLGMSADMLKMRGTDKFVATANCQFGRVVR